MKAVICPVCNGSGKYRATDSGGAWVESTCHGCCGKGWVEVNESAQTVITYPAYPTYPFPGTIWPVITCGGTSTTVTK